MSQTRRQGLKVIYITGGDLTRFTMHAADDLVLQKPIRPDVLIETIRTTLARAGGDSSASV